MKNKKRFVKGKSSLSGKNQKISTALGTIVLVIVAITVGTFVWKIEKNQPIVEQSLVNISSVSKAENLYSNSNYGFSLYLPNYVDKYIIQVSPDTIGKISFLLPATNQKYIKVYTGFIWADVFNVLAYPKIKINEIKKGCGQDSGQDKPYYKCTLINSKPIAENDTYSFYYLKGGTSYLTYYVPPAFDPEIYTESENALKTFKVFSATLSYNENTWHVFRDTKYGFEIEYPSDWTLDFHAPSIMDASVYPNIINGSIGEIIFDNNYINDNESISNSIEDNLKLVNSNVNLIGTKSRFKEMKIKGGRAFYSPLSISISSSERAFYIIGKNIILNGTFQSNSMDKQTINKFVEILSHFKFL